MVFNGLVFNGQRTRLVLLAGLLFLVDAIFINAVAVGQLPNLNGQVWREYPAGPLYPPHVQAFQAAPPELPVAPPTLLDIIDRETDRTTWTGPNFGMIGTDGRKLFVYHTPEVQRKVAETVGRFLRQETQKTAFLMETKFVTLSESFFDRMAAGHGETTVYTDIRSPVEAYLHPITGPDGKPRLRTPGASAYWVAKEDIPKLYEGWSRLFDAAEGDTRSDLLTGPKTAAFNGQLGVLLDVAPKQFVTDTVMVGGTRQPVTNTFFEGQAIAGFSLLSWDGKTVDTDVFVEFSKITRVETLHSVPEEIEIRTPHLEKRTLSEKGLRWPVDGMLVLIQGTERLAERTYEYGTPVLNKIPYLNRLFMQRAVGRETTTIYSIITVRLADPLETTALLSARQP